MKKITFSSSALVITGLVVSLAGCSQTQALDPRTKAELVRIVEVGSPSGANRAFTGWFQHVFRAISVSEFPEKSRSAW